MGILRRCASLSWVTFFATIFAVTIVGFLSLWPQPAKADPHALYFTTVGQQQLFFNILAALDQADYVEPATGPNSRANLLEKRDAAATSSPAPTAEDRLENTITNLPTVLTRQITLEGYDFWTAYQAQLLAIEVARRNGLDELARVFCERALGRAGCSNKITAANLTQSQDEAFVRDPQNRLKEVGAGGATALSSGTISDLAKRNEYKNPTKPELLRPRTYDPFAARFNQETATNAVTDRAAARIRAGVSEAGNAALGNPYGDLAIAADGKVRTRQPDGDAIASSLQAMLNAPDAALVASLEGQEKIQAFQAAEQGTGGTLADSKPVLPTDTNAQVLDIKNVITTPVGAKEAQLAGLTNIIGNASSNLAYAPAAAESNVGDDPLVSGRAQVSGIQTSINQPGQVAGIFDWIIPLVQKIYQYYDKDKTPTNPGVNPITPTKEEGLLNATQALTNDTYRQYDETTQNCGFCVSADSILDSVWYFVIDILCALGLLASNYCPAS